jgi:hypothetical protein
MRTLQYSISNSDGPYFVRLGQVCEHRGNLCWLLGANTKLNFQLRVSTEP